MVDDGTSRTSSPSMEGRNDHRRRGERAWRDWDCDARRNHDNLIARLLAGPGPGKKIKENTDRQPAPGAVCRGPAPRRRTPGQGLGPHRAAAVDRLPE